MIQELNPEARKHFCFNINRIIIIIIIIVLLVRNY